MRHVAGLITSRPPRRWPDETLVVEGLGSDAQRMAATRGEDYAFVYFPEPMSRTIRMDGLGDTERSAVFKDALFDKTVSNMQEVMARKGKVLLVSDSTGIAEASDGVWATIRMPRVHPALSPILYAVPAQLLAYHTAVAKGTDVDQPRNLAKSVTVE